MTGDKKMSEEYNSIETTNINFKWLENILAQLISLQEMERLTREGCVSLIEYLQVPIEYQKILLPEVQYKNLKFMSREIDMLISNLRPILKGKADEYAEKIAPVMRNINNRPLFLKEVKHNGAVVQINTLDFFKFTADYVIQVKSQIINDIGHILYLPNEDKKKSW